MDAGHATSTSHPHPLRRKFERHLGLADIRVDGSRPWDMQVHDDSVFWRLLMQGSLGLGESYMDGDWDAVSLDGLLFRLLDSRLDEHAGGVAGFVDSIRARVMNLQTRHRSLEVGRAHYDLGNDLYRAMLGAAHDLQLRLLAPPRGAARPGTAQEAKLDLVFRKLDLQPRPARARHRLRLGRRVALRGGAIRRHRRRHHHVPSSRPTCAQAALRGPADRDPPRRTIVRSTGTSTMSSRSACSSTSAPRNYRDYFRVARRCLSSDGLFLLHSIGRDVSSTHTDPWIDRYVFPNSMLPSPVQIAQAIEGLFTVEDWHNFGADYDLTLQAWRRNIERAWPTLDPRYDERFRRMWRYYLAVSMAVFRCRRAHLWQIVLSPHGVPGGYVAPR